MNSVIDYGTNLAGAYEASMGTAGKQMKSMERYSEDLKVKFGSLFDEATREAVTFGSEGLKRTAEWFDQNEVAARELSLALGEATRSLTSLFSVANGGGTSAAKLSTWFTDAIGTGFALSEDFIRMNVTMNDKGPSAFRKHIEAILGREDELEAFAARAAGAKALTSTIEALQHRWNVLAVGDTGKSSVRSEMEELNLQIDRLKYQRAWMKAGAKDERMDGPVYTPEVATVNTAALKAVQDYKKHLGQLNAELDKERILMDQGALAAYRFTLGLQGIHQKDIESLVSKRSMIDMDKAMIDMDKKLLEGRLKLVEVNPDIQKGLFRGFQRAQDLGDPSRMGLDYLQQDRADLERWKDTMPLENYKKALQGISLAEMKLKAEHGEIWAGMGMVINSYTDQATESLMRLFDGGASGFREMTASMLRDMEKLILKQQLMQPLMNGLGAGITGLGSGGWAGFLAGFAKGWGGGKATGGTVYGDTSYLVGERGPEIFTPGRTGYITPNHALGGQTTISAPITVVVQSDGSTSVKGGDSIPNMKALGEMMGAKCREVLVTESRAGGMLNPANGGGIRG